MNLREQLRNLLPEFLPRSPEDAIKGTDLIRLVRLQLGNEYSDATLRYHFSILCYDPTSPIAKVDQGQGYYQRQKKLSAATISGARLGLFDHSGPEVDAARLRYLQVAAIYERLCVSRARNPFLLNGRHSPPVIEGDWDVPDFVVGDSEFAASADEEAAASDQSMLELRRRLGGPEVILTGVQLKLSLTLDSYPSDFFQSLSATRWAVESELVVAEPLADAALVDALRSLGHQFGVGISSLGLDLSRLDDLPTPQDLRAMGATEFEYLCGRLHLQKITLATPRPSLDWAALSALRKKHESVGEMVRWLNESLEKGRPPA